MTIEVKTVNKILEDEGNYKEFSYRTYRCYIKRVQEMGHLCGYVAISKDNKLYGKSWDEIEETEAPDIVVHGGITYCDDNIPGQPETEGRDLWYIGFDCAHAGDLMPFMLQGMTLDMMRLKFMTDLVEGHTGDDFLKRTETYKDMKYVTKELKRLVRQLIKYESDGEK
jgi:hypothetical protein